MDRLRAAAEAAGIDIVTEARAETLLVRRMAAWPASRSYGLTAHGTASAAGPDPRLQWLWRQQGAGCGAYPGTARRSLFRPSRQSGRGRSLGQALGADLIDLSGHQGHGSVAEPHGILLTWATMTEGGFQVNRLGQRFADESRGYSEHAAAVLAQPERLGWSIFDARIAGIARQFEDFPQPEAAGGVIQADSIAELATRLALPQAALVATAAAVDAAKAGGLRDETGRDWAGVPPLSAPYCGVKITGALFHTQGGLAIDASARVLKPGGTPLPNLFAVGGAAAGVSGPEASGYLSGNGLLTAVALGYLAGQAAAIRAL